MYDKKNVFTRRISLLFHVEHFLKKAYAILYNFAIYTQFIYRFVCKRYFIENQSVLKDVPRGTF